MINQPPIIKVNPFNYAYEKWPIRNSEVEHALDGLQATDVIKNFQDKDFCPDVDTLLYQQAFLLVINETAFNYPNPYLSEKTFKAIASNRPFVIAGAPGTLNLLHNIGFKTFSNIWDESYDQILDPTDRILAVVNIVEWVCTKSINELKDLYNEIEDILKYNFYFYKTQFKSSQLQKFEDFCKNNLNPRYD